MFIRPGGFSGFQVMGMFKWGKHQTPKKSLGLPKKPQKNPWAKKLTQNNFPERIVL